MPWDKFANIEMAFTFGDVILLPGKTQVEPSEVDLSTRLGEIGLHVPILSSPMDTVTEAEMAIAVARMGALGVLHRNCTVEEQVNMAKAVKRAESFIIRDVVTVTPDDTVETARSIMKEMDISGLPVVAEGRLVGIITRRDVYFAEDGNQVVREVMTKDVITVSPDITPQEARKIMSRYKIEKLPVVDDYGRLVGLITAKDVFYRESHPFATRDGEGRLRVAAAISPFDLERAKALEPYVDLLVTDVAHFHNENVMRAVKRITEEVNVPLVAGNIGTYEAAEEIITRLDVVGLRVGIASGSICTTGEVTGVAAPTLFAVAKASEVVAKYGSDVAVIADGGVRGPAEAAKAFAAGADAVMLGFALAGTKESPGSPLIVGGKMYKVYRGMGSPSARSKRFALDRYSKPSKDIAEGIEGLVPYRGDVATVIDKFVAGLRAAFGYVGAANIGEMKKKARIALLSSVGAREIAPHDVKPMEKFSA
ncbi:MAG: IMP dehydrogenase [Candidatus Korarchaeota archaeon]|nr:IMP dehydrogenase [Candidatus Korarchaeota archaeon]